ncbi:MAG: ORF6N domain-containing protein [Acidobacteria bacterium]|nr:ORF6N domain-containing protein [Acidobacteriota bacterium]
MPKTRDAKTCRLDQLPLPEELIGHRILTIRGHRVMLDRDLAMLYEVKAIALRQQVKRNVDRFPEDFMLQLSDQETNALLSQNVIPSPQSLGGSFPYAFTEQGVAMLSSVLTSKRAVQVNIAIMRTFVRLREMLASHKDLAHRLDEMEKKYDHQFKVVFEAIRDLMSPASSTHRRRIGFSPPINGTRGSGDAIVSLKKGIVLPSSNPSCCF